MRQTKLLSTFAKVCSRVIDYWPVVLPGMAGFLVAMAIAWSRWPEPSMHDDFGNLLVATTLLEGRSLDSVVQTRGKFRSYLLGAVKHFLADERAKQMAEKRGRLVLHIAVDQVDDLSLNTTAFDSMPPDAYFDRQWAMSILEHALKDLELELGTDNATRFELIRPWLSGDSIDLSHADMAARLGVSVDVVKTTIHRWRKRFREIVKGHIASTVSNVSEVDEELGYLIQALAMVNRGV